MIKRKNTVILIIAVISITLISLTTFIFLIVQAFNSSLPSPLNSKANNVLARISKLMILPENETPTIATVTNEEDLKDRLFYKNAKNGDIVILYPNAGKAIIYDPKENIIVDAAPLKFQESTQTANLNESGQKRLVNVAVLNGTNTKDLAKKMSDEINAKLDNISVEYLGNAKGTFPKSLVFDPSGQNEEKSRQIAQNLNILSTKIIPDEAVPQEATKDGRIIDIVIVAGEDYSNR